MLERPTRIFAVISNDFIATSPWVISVRLSVMFNIEVMTLPLSLILMEQLDIRIHDETNMFSFYLN
jgi:hypothetical protein